MHHGTTPSPARRLPRARVTLPMFGLVAVALFAGPKMRGAVQPDEAAILSLASDRGMVPVEARPALGTEIFQWDVELRDFEPFFVGAVTNSDLRSRGKHYVVVKRPHAPALLLAIREHEMRYWVRKP